MRVESGGDRSSACAWRTGNTGAATRVEGAPLTITAGAKDQIRRIERFERIRGQLLPYVWDGGRRPCEERIGRLCLWHGGEDDWEPGPDSPDLVEARDELLTTLAGAADHIPADEWILGQRVRYLG